MSTTCLPSLSATLISASYVLFSTSPHHHRVSTPMSITQLTGVAVEVRPGERRLSAQVVDWLLEAVEVFEIHSSSLLSLNNHQRRS